MEKEKLRKELEQLNLEMDRIIQAGGRILLNDPLLLKSKSIKLKLQQL